MFKKAKRANFRRRNASDEEDQEEGRQPPAAPLPSFGPVAEEIPFMETSENSVPAAPSGADNYHSNGLQLNVCNVRAVKKEKKGKEPPVVTATPAGPTKASLLSFDDDEGKLTW